MVVIERVVIVEGRSDKLRVEAVLGEAVEVICTQGTMSVEKMDDILLQVGDRAVYVLVDADQEGSKIRQWFKRELSEATHIFIDTTYGEVARCPLRYLARTLSKYDFDVAPDLMDERKQVWL